MAKVIEFRRPETPVVKFEREDIPLSALYAARRDALDKGDVELADAIDQRVQEMYNRSD